MVIIVYQLSRDKQGAGEKPVAGTVWARYEAPPRGTRNPQDGGVKKRRLSGVLSADGNVRFCGACRQTAFSRSDVTWRGAEALPTGFSGSSVGKGLIVRHARRWVRVISRLSHFRELRSALCLTNPSAGSEDAVQAIFGSV